MPRLLLMCALLSCAACADRRPIITTPPAACSKLIPSDWTKGVAATPVPANTDTSAWIGKPLTDAIEAAIIAPWAAAYVAQDGQIEKANGRTADTVQIVQTCEDMVNAARPDAK